MNSKLRCYSLSTLATLLLISCIAFSSGCINLAANMIHAIQGNMVPAEFDGLSGKRVAIVCRTDEGLKSSATNTILHNNLQAALAMHLEDVKLVRRSQLEKWYAQNPEDRYDYYKVGEGVDADLVVAVEVSNLKLKNGQTLYRGVSDISVKVLDMEREVLLFHKQMPEISFPNSTGKPITDTSENKFRQFYLAYVTRKIGALFYPVDAHADYAIDATMSSF